MNKRKKRDMVMDTKDCGNVGTFTAWNADFLFLLGMYFEKH